MATTQLYIELIIIGLESFIWMGVFLINIIGEKIINVFDMIFKNFPSSLLFLGILYIIGIIMEGLAEIILQKYEDKIRHDSKIETVNTDLIWGKYGAEKYSDYTRSKIRILRASILNMPLITVAFFWCAVSYLEEPYMTIIYIIVIGIVSTIICIKSHRATLKRYYNKALALENSEKKDD